MVVVALVASVVVVSTVRASLPKTSRQCRAAGSGRRRHRDARRQRHPAHLRRQPHRPGPRAGLRARPGAVLPDGPAPAHHRRPARRAGRHGRHRGRQGHPHAGVAAHRRGGAAHPQAGDPADAAGLRRRREHLPARPQPPRGGGRVHGARPDPVPRRDRGVVAGRQPLLAEGDGLGPQGQLRRRARPRPAGGAADHGADQPDLPAVRRRGAPADPRARRVVAAGAGARHPVGGALRPHHGAGDHEDVGCRRPARRRPGHQPVGPGRLRDRARGTQRHPPARRARRGRGLQLVGGGRLTHDARASPCSPTTRTSASASPASGSRTA